MYSATEAREDAAEAVSQSLSVLLLALRLSVGKASRDSTLWRRRDKGQTGWSQAHVLAHAGHWPVALPTRSPVQGPSAAAGDPVTADGRAPGCSPRRQKAQTHACPGEGRGQHDEADGADGPKQRPGHRPVLLGLRLLRPSRHLPTPCFRAQPRPLTAGKACPPSEHSRARSSPRRPRTGWIPTGPGSGCRLPETKGRLQVSVAESRGSAARPAPRSPGAYGLRSPWPPTRPAALPGAPTWAAAFSAWTWGWPAPAPPGSAAACAAGTPA